MPSRRSPGLAQLRPGASLPDMKASVFVDNNAPLVVEELTLDDPGPSEVHVKWAASGVCHSDVSVWNGKLPLPPPSILGHEGAGVVVAAGETVAGFKTGDHVVGNFKPLCGDCFYCNSGQSYICEQSMMLGMGRMPWNRGDGSKLMGAIGGLGTFAEESVVHEGALVKINNDTALEEAALIGCGVTTGIGSALFAADVQPGSTCVVIGCGGVGQAVVQGCRIAGAENIVALDLNASKRNAAQEHGATHAIDPSKGDADALIKSLTNNRGADYVFEVVGTSALQRQAYDLTRPGGSVVWVGVAGMMDETSLPAAMITLDNKRVIGTIYGSANPRTDFAKFIDYAKQGKLDLKGMVSQRIGIHDINEAFTAMLEGDVIRSVVIYD